VIPTTPDLHHGAQPPGRKGRTIAWFSAIIGYILSPLSWWNDLFVNVPLAYLFALPFSLLSERLYLPTFVLGYWLSNVLGLLMLQQGGMALLKKQHTAISWKGLLISTTLYTALIVILVLTGVLPSANELATRYL
jgi:hypothetical protein